MGTAVAVVVVVIVVAPKIGMNSPLFFWRRGVNKTSAERLRVIFLRIACERIVDVYFDSVVL